MYILYMLLLGFCVMEEEEEEEVRYEGEQGVEHLIKPAARK